MGRKRGKYRKDTGFYRDKDSGREIHGLKRRPPGDDRFYAADEPTRTFGRDPSQAIFRFRQWEARRKADTIRVRTPPESKFPLYPKDNSILAQAARILIEEHCWEELPAGPIWEAIGREIRRDPSAAAERLGIPQIRHINSLTPLAPSSTLTDIGKIREEQLVPGVELRHFRLHWKEFVRSVDVRTARDVTKMLVSRYADELRVRFKGGKLSWDALRHRFSDVKSAFNAAKSRVADGDEIRQLSVWLTDVLKPPQKRGGSKPHPISRDDFEKLIRVCEPRMRAVLLFALNTAAYPIDIATCRREYVSYNESLKRHVYSCYRNKTNVLRTAVLWPRTFEAIREFQRAEPLETDWLFPSTSGTKWCSEGVRVMFVARREKAGVPDAVKFDGLRDSTKTRAIEIGGHYEQTKLILGHKLPGLDDSYLQRSPQLVLDACDAVERYYFGPKPASTDAISSPADGCGTPAAVGSGRRSRSDRARRS